MASQDLNRTFQPGYIVTYVNINKIIKIIREYTVNKKGGRWGAGNQANTKHPLIVKYQTTMMQKCTLPLSCSAIFLSNACRFLRTFSINSCSSSDESEELVSRELDLRCL